MKIVLTGMSGIGKTTIGKNLSEALGYSFIDTDISIKENMNMEIDEIFEEYGEGFFRDLETKETITTKNAKRTVIATGGGIITREENIKNLSHNGKIFFLDGSVDTLLSNLQKSKVIRPLLVNDMKNSLVKLYRERYETYKSSADYIVNVDNKTIDEITEEIVTLVEEELD